MLAHLYNRPKHGLIQKLMRGTCTMGWDPRDNKWASLSFGLSTTNSLHGCPSIWPPPSSTALVCLLRRQAQRSRPPPTKRSRIWDMWLGEIATTTEWRSKKLASPRSTIPRSGLAIFSLHGRRRVRGPPPGRTARVLLTFVEIFFLVYFRFLCFSVNGSGRWFWGVSSCVLDPWIWYKYLCLRNAKDTIFGWPLDFKFHFLLNQYVWSESWKDGVIHQKIMWLCSLSI
jgi:hypothetical protein